MLKARLPVAPFLRDTTLKRIPWVYFYYPCSNNGSCRVPFPNKPGITSTSSNAVNIGKQAHGSTEFHHTKQGNKRTIRSEDLFWRAVALLYIVDERRWPSR